jgi:hypothetical protein
MGKRYDGANKFFAEAGQSKDFPVDMLEYTPGLFSPIESDALLKQFIAEAPWKQRVQKIWEKEVLTPRLTAWYGERLEEETYSMDTQTIYDQRKIGTFGWRDFQ